MDKQAKIFIAGHSGLVGSAILRCLERLGFDNFVLRRSGELDLRNQQSVLDFFESERPAYVFLAAAKVGGILANNTYRAEFLFDNLMIASNVIDAAHRFPVKKLLFLGSSCIYPKLAEQPMREDALLTGPLESTNEPYAIAKIAGIKLCETYRHQYGCRFISAMPTNLYGPNDNFDLETSHVLPALIRKFHEAKEQNKPEVTLWGTGSPFREFLHVDDLADASVFLMEEYEEAQLINVGSGREVTIADLAQLIRTTVGYDGEIVYDTSKPDGTPRKLMDSSRLQTLGWTPKITLEQGVKQTYDWYLQSLQTVG